MSVSTCGGLIHGGGLYLEVYGSMENFPGTLPPLISNSLSCIGFH